MSLLDKLSKIEYSGYIVSDITKRFAMSKVAKNDNTVIQDYSIEGHEKAEHLAFDFYGSADHVWLIYLANDIVDPFYGWILSDNVLSQVIEDKYGAGNENVVHHYLLDGEELPDPLYGFSSSLSNPAMAISSELGQIRHDTVAGDMLSLKNATMSRYHSGSGKYYIEYRITSGDPADFVFGLGLTDANIRYPVLADYDGLTMSYPAASNTELGIALTYNGTAFTIHENFDGAVSLSPQQITQNSTSADNFGIVLDLDNNEIQFYIDGLVVGSVEHTPAAREYSSWVPVISTQTGTAQILDSAEQEYFATLQESIDDLQHWQTEPVHDIAIPITNEEHETRINESKRKIKIIRPNYLASILNELENQ